GDGPSRAASARAAVGPWVCAAFSERWLCALPHRRRDAFRVLGTAAAAPGQRRGAQTPLDASAYPALRASGQNPATATPRRGEASHRVWHESGGGRSFGGVWLADQHGVCRKAQFESAPTRSSDATAQCHLVSGRRRGGPALGAVPGLPQLCVIAWRVAPGAHGTKAHPWHGLGQGVAPLYAGDGGRLDGPCVVDARGVALSGAAVAPAADGLRTSGSGAS